MSTSSSNEPETPVAQRRLAGSECLTGDTTFRVPSQHQGRNQPVVLAAGIDRDVAEKILTLLALPVNADAPPRSPSNCLEDASRRRNASLCSDVPRRAASAVPVTAKSEYIEAALPQIDFDADYTASLNDHIPFHLSRWILLAIFSFFLIFNGQCVGNWPPFRSMLVDDKAFAWECKDTDLLDGDGTCETQRNTLATLSNVASSMVFVGSALAGALVDYIGPKFLASGGSVFTALGYALLALSSESCPMYFPGFVFLSLGIEPVMTGLFDFPFLFPGMGSTILSVLALGRSLGYAYPIMMQSLWSPFFGSKYIFMIAAIIAVFWTVVLFMLIPRYPYLSPEQFEVLLALEAMAETPQFEPGSLAFAASAPPDMLADLDVGDLKTSADSWVGGAISESLSSDSTVYRPLTAAALEGRLEGDAPLENERVGKSVHSMDRRTNTSGVWPKFFEVASSYKFFPWLILFALNAFRGNFYGSAASDQLGDASQYYVIMSPLSFIPCVPFGILADRYSIFPVMSFIQICGFMAVLVLAIKECAVTQYLSVSFWWFLMSYSTSQNYVFCSQLFPQQVMSKLTGLAMLIAGIIAIFASFLYSYGSRTSFSKADGILSGTSAVQLGLVVLLYFAHRRKLKIRKELRRMEKQQAVDRTIARTGSRLATAASRVKIDANQVPSRPASLTRQPIDSELYKQVANEHMGNLGELFGSPIAGIGHGGASPDKRPSQMRENDSPI